MDGVVMSRRIGHAGFSLIEAMLALLILTVGCVGVVGMFLVADRAMAGAAAFDRAVASAGEIIEARYRASTDDAVDGGDLIGPLQRRWRLRPHQPADGFALLSVTVAWRDATTRARQLEVVLVRADPRAGAP